MRKTFMLGVVLLLSAVWLQAQQYPQGTSSSNQVSTTASGETTVEGCLQGSNGNFTLTDKNGMTYQIQGDSSKLSEHIGHQVRITGSTSGSSSTASGTGTESTAAQQPTLQVQSVKHVSKSCKSTSK